MTACTCGYEPSPDARFCGGCGRSIHAADVTVLDLTEPETSTDQAVVKAGPSPRRRMAVAGAVCAGLLAWSAWSLTIGGSGATDAAPSNTSTPDGTDAAASDDAPDGEAASTTTTSQPSSSTERTTTTPEPIQLDTIATPILGEEVGYDLIIATVDRPAILDLDSGEIRYAEGSRADPLAVTGHWLIAGRDDQPFILDLDDLEADPIHLPFAATGWPQLADDRQRDDGRAWFRLSGPDLDESGVVLVDVATGKIVEEAAEPEPTPLYYWVPAIPADGATLISTPAGGIYEARGVEVHRVADGVLLVADDHRALVETCDDRLRCSVQWLDRETWRPADLAVPDDFGDDGRFLNGTDWMVLFDYGTDIDADLFNVTTGSRVELPERISEPPNNYGHGPAVSPDGRWLATTSTGEVRLMELDTGREIVVNGIANVTGPAIFFERTS